MFKTIPDLAFVADDQVMSVREHVAMMRTGVTFVAQSLEGPHAGKIIGFICGHEVRRTLHICQMAVLASGQNRGVGSALVAAMLDDAVSSKCETATLTTFRDVPWNDGFYKKLGFRTLEPNEIDPRLQAILTGETAAGLPGDRRCAMAIKLT